MGSGGQGGCERRIEVFVKIQKIYIYFFLFFGGGGGGSGWECQGRCERRIEVFEKIQKKNSGLGGGGGRVDVNEELKFLWRYMNKFLGGRGVRRIWSGVGLGIRVDVNEELKFLRKFTKKSGGRGLVLGGIWVEVNEELKFL